jgi:hypothetical protein
VLARYRIYTAGAPRGHRGDSRDSVVKFLSDTQTGGPPHRLNMRPCGSGAVWRLAAWCLPARGRVVTAPLIAPVIPSGPARYGWCQNKEG